MTDRPLIVVFGNCQAEAVASTMASLPELRDRFDFHYHRSFQAAGQEAVQPLSAANLQRVEFVFEQATAKVRFDQAASLPKKTRITPFVSLDFNPLWPLHIHEKRSVPEPDFPFGWFPYGDRAIASVVADGLTGDEGYEAYLSRSDAMLRNLDRVLEIEKKRWAIIESVTGSDFLNLVLDGFREKKLFHTFNHPSRDAITLVASHVLAQSGLLGCDQGKIEELVRPYVDHCWDASGLEAPIHAKVAQAFDLEWWSPDMTYNWNGRPYGSEALIRAQIDWRRPDLA